MLRISGLYTTLETGQVCLKKNEKDINRHLMIRNYQYFIDMLYKFRVESFVETVSTFSILWNKLLSFDREASSSELKGCKSYRGEDSDGR